MVENPASTRAGTWLRHRRPLSGNPCSNTTGGPSPVTSYSMPTPPTSTRIVSLFPGWPREGQSASGCHDGQKVAATRPQRRSVAPPGSQGERLLEQRGVGEDLVGRPEPRLD